MLYLHRRIIGVCILVRKAAGRNASLDTSPGEHRYSFNYRTIIGENMKTKTIKNKSYDWNEVDDICMDHVAFMRCPICNILNFYDNYADSNNYAIECCGCKNMIVVINNKRDIE